MKNVEASGNIPLGPTHINLDKPHNRDKINYRALALLRAARLCRSTDVPFIEA